MIKLFFKRIIRVLLALLVFLGLVFWMIRFAPGKLSGAQSQGMAVMHIIAESLPTSLALGCFSLIIALLLGSSLGVAAALKQNAWVDYSLSGVILLGVSLPLFVVAPLLVWVFSVTLKMLPPSGWYQQGVNRMIMPIVSLSFPYVATIARVMRGSMIDVMRSSYIRTAKAKGLSTFVIVFRHALRPAFLAVMGYLGPALAGLVTGTLVVEQIFHIPGLSHPLMRSAMNADYTLIMGCVVTYAFVLVAMNIVIDFLYTLLDPRLAYS